MVASDTVIGVVGAVLLAAVMVGVFVYEYNNTPEGADPGQESRDTFEQDYPGMNATADLDGDGKANFEDDDFDGDGVANAQDTDVKTTVPVTGGFLVAQPGASYTSEVEVQVHTGMQSFDAAVFYNMTLPSPLGFSPLQMVLIDEAGEQVGDPAQETVANGGTAVELRLSSDALEPGTYRLRLSATGPGSPTMTSYEGSASVYYGLGYAADGHQH